MERRRQRRPPEVSEETARLLFWTYGHAAVEMAEVRCAELEAAGDQEGLAGWREVLEHVRVLVAANPKQNQSQH
jgi:hypothetical protein